MGTRQFVFSENDLYFVKSGQAFEAWPLFYCIK